MLDRSSVGYGERGVMESKVSDKVSGRMACHSESWEKCWVSCLERKFKSLFFALLKFKMLIRQLNI